MTGDPIPSPAAATAPTYDLLVIGGGINGAGIARDAALRGLRVCLLEAHDWGWGTSAKSSKLAHGGLRYLELFEFGLVHEALQDREIMLHQAPHLVRPLRFLYPIYPHVAARRAVRAGLFLYDLLSHGKSVPGRAYLKRDQVLQEVPGLNPEGLRGGAIFYDGQIQSVERLVAELIWDAKKHGALCRNHSRVTRILTKGSGDDKRAVGVEYQDADGATGTVYADAIVNAAGTWVDDVLGPLGAGKPPKVRKTKGIHVVLPRFTDTALIVKSRVDGRTFFILPWQDHCVVGTTDTDYQGDAGEARAEPDEVQYLLESTLEYFPEAPVDDIRYTYAGVRALVNEEGVTESNVTRRHILYDHDEEEGLAGLWSLQGGKITTYRSLAEGVVDEVCRNLDRKDLAKMRPTRTGTLPGGPDGDWPTFRADAVVDAQQRYGLPHDSAANLIDNYGARWQAVLDCDRSDHAHQPITPGRPELWCQITYAVQEEQACTLGDVMLRRTMLGLSRDAGAAVAKKVAKRMADLLGWGRLETRRQLKHYQEEAARFGVVEPRRRPTTRP